MSTYTSTGPPAAWNVAIHQRSVPAAAGTHITWSTGANHSTPGRVKRVPPATPHHSPYSSLPRYAASNSQCGRSPHFDITTRIAEPGVGVTSPFYQPTRQKFWRVSGCFS